MRFIVKGVRNPPPDKDTLLDLYKLHSEEIRFQLKLNWDRTQYFLVLNVGILGVAATLWKAGTSDAGAAIVAALFLVGAFTASMARNAVKQGHRYYRRETVQRARVEYLLGLHDVDPGDGVLAPLNLTVSNTKGTLDAVSMLNDPEGFVARDSARRGQIAWYLDALFILLCGIDILGLLVSLGHLLGGRVTLPQVRLGTFDIGLSLTIATGISMALIAVSFGRAAWKALHKTRNRRGSLAVGNSSDSAAQSLVEASEQTGFPEDLHPK